LRQDFTIETRSVEILMTDNRSVPAIVGADRAAAA
jgi:hypothetical protein